MSFNFFSQPLFGRPPAPNGLPTVKMEPPTPTAQPTDLSAFFSDVLDPEEFLAASPAISRGSFAGASSHPFGARVQSLGALRAAQSDMASGVAGIAEGGMADMDSLELKLEPGDDDSSEGMDDAEREMKRASHNCSEQKRRDNIKEGFVILRSAIPTLKEGTSRAVILKKSVEYIEMLKKQNKSLSTKVTTGNNRARAQSQLAPRRMSTQALGASDEKVTTNKITYAALVEAIEKRLNLRDGVRNRLVRLMYREEGLMVDVSTEEDLLDYFRKCAISKEVKLSLYVTRPNSSESSPMPESPAVVAGDNPAAMTPLGVAGLDPAGEILEDDEASPAVDDQEVVDEDCVRALHSRLAQHPGMVLGGLRFQQPEWQLGRVYRFVKACSNDFELAEKMILAHFDWLHTFKPEQITAMDIRNELKANKLYWHKHDINGRPCMIFKVARHHVQKRDKYETLRHWIYMVQDFMERRALNPRQQFVFLYDRSESTRLNSDVPMLQKFVRMFQQNYPETMHCMYVLQADFVFKYGYSIVKRFASKAFRRKIRLLGDDWRDHIRDHFTPDCLQIEYGGTSNYIYAYDENDLDTVQTGV
eukprot:Opistho-2@58348